MDGDDFYNLGQVSVPSLVTRRQGDQFGYSKVTYDKNGFSVLVDCSRFKPEELSVKMVDGDVVIHAKHEEKQDDFRYIRREFTRRYSIPRNVIVELMSSTLDTSGFLTVKAPVKATEGKERVIPIQMRPKSALKRRPIK